MAPNTPETLRLLVVSRAPAVLRPLESAAQSNFWRLETSASGWDAMERVQSGIAPHLLLLHLPRKDRDGLHLLPWLRRLRPELPIVVLCDAGDGDKQKEAIRLGAKDVLCGLLNEGQLTSVVRRHLRSSNDDAGVEMASEDIEALGEDDFFISVSPAMQQLRAQAELLAQADVPVLILGEQGSGKDTIARLIHQMSVYSGFKFLRVNCAEMPADLLEIELFGRENGYSDGLSRRVDRAAIGKLESGQKGTVFIDEIAEMPLPLQSKILKVLQEKRFARSGNPKRIKVDVRILAASRDKLDLAVADKRLDPELYYHLSAFTVHVPPLRDRKEEIDVLLRYFMHKMAKYYGLGPREFTQSALDACQNYSWPGNVKELEAFVKRYLVAGDEELAVSRSESASRRLGRDDVERSKSAISKSLKSIVQSLRWEAEKNAITVALEKTGWNRKAAARLLGVSYRTILYKIEQYRMAAPDSTGAAIPH
jgi:two-component system, NtrC family, response regulator AtoC